MKKIFNRFFLFGFCILLFGIQDCCLAQDFYFKTRKKKERLRFNPVRNLVVVNLYLNELGPYNFILDSGVGPMIITDPSILQISDLKSLRQILIRGLGGSDLNAYVSISKSVRIGRVYANNLQAAVLERDEFNLSGYMGMPIHGILGAQFFNSFVVDVNYASHRVIIHNPISKLKPLGMAMPIEIRNLRPYVQGMLTLEDGMKAQVQLLIDLGGSFALSLEQLNQGAFPLPSKKITANLGLSISGPIYGVVGRVPTFQLGSYTFTDVLSSFPSYDQSKELYEDYRQGSVGAETLRRFNIRFNYAQKYIELKPLRAEFSDPFEYDMSGLVLAVFSDKRPYIYVADVVEHSPAKEADFKVNDVLIGINFMPIENFTLSEVITMLSRGGQKTLVIEIARGEESLFKVLQLKRRI